MKSVEITVQEKADFCVCSVIQVAFRRNKKEISQEEIARNLTPSKDGFLVQDQRIKIFMEKHGFFYSCFGVNETPFNEPYELLKEMCQYEGIIGMRFFSPGNKQEYVHAYLLKSFDNSKVKLIDPIDGKEVERNYPQILGEIGQRGFLGLIKYMS